MDQYLTERVIIITGGTKGVGRALALAAGEMGANVVVGGRNVEDGERVISEIRESGGRNAVFVKGDLSYPQTCQALVQTAVEEFGRVDGLVNYAGILPTASLTDTTEELFNDVFDVNVKASFFCTKYVVEVMQKTGGGSIVFIGSSHAYGGEEDRAVYACSKGMLLTLMKHVAGNYAKHRIRSNWVTMGWVATPGEMAMRESQGRDLTWLENTAAEQIPLGRLLTDKDHIPGILYLLSDQSSMVTGTELHICGGFMI